MSDRRLAALGSARKPLKRLRDLALRAHARLGYALGAPRPKQIVVCGYPRSGTSLLYNMLSASLEGYLFGHFEVPCLQYVRDRGPFVSKRPLDVFALEKLVAHNVFDKRLYAVVVIRDLRGVLTSIHPRVPQDYFIGYDASYEVGPDYPHGSKRLHPGIAAYYEQIERLSALEGLTRVVVRYEDLVADPDAIQNRLAEALGVHFTRRFSTFHERPELHAYRYAGAERPVDASRVRENDAIDASRRDRWRSPEHRSHIAAEFGAHPQLFEMLRAYGYEPHDRWFEAFTGEAPACAAAAAPRQEGPERIREAARKPQQAPRSPSKRRA